jgi:hypothetical protein
MIETAALCSHPWSIILRPFNRAKAHRNRLRCRVPLAEKFKIGLFSILRSNLAAHRAIKLKQPLRVRNCKGAFWRLG